MITSLGAGELAAGLGLGVGDAVVLALGVDDGDAGGDGLVATAETLEVGEESEPIGWACPQAATTTAQTAIPVARLAVIRSTGS
jgi:hypothetical protein